MMKIATLLILALFTGCTEALRGDKTDNRQLQTEYGCGFTGCTVCDRELKIFPNGDSRRPGVLTFIYRPNGQNSLYQPEDKASCRAGSYPQSTTLTVEGQTITVSAGQQFDVVAADGDKFPADLDFQIAGFGTCFIHASCSVPIVQGDVIGPFEVVGDDKVCEPCPVCIKADKPLYNCGDAITSTFDITGVPDLLNQAVGALPSDWIGIYPCNVPFTAKTMFYPAVNKYVCDQFTPGDSAACQAGTAAYNTGSVVIDRLPSYGELGPYLWPVTAFFEDLKVNNQFKVVIMRNEAPSPPPFVPICESECFTIRPNAATQICKVRADLTELPPPGGFGCFPGDAAVQVEGKGPVSMKDISLGDKVLTSGNKFEPVYSFGHKNSKSSVEYLKLTTSVAAIELSVDHMVYVRGGAAVPARIVQVGDEIEIVDGTFSSVLDVELVDKQGVYAPFTPSGSIVVNGIKASSFVAFQESANVKIAGIDTGVSFQFLAHTFEFPHRMWCLHLSSCETETYSEEGISNWVKLPHAVISFLFSENALVLVAVALATLAVASKTTIRLTGKKSA